MHDTPSLSATSPRSQEPRIFRVVLGRIAHAALGPNPLTFCGRDLHRRPGSEGLTAREAYRRTECRVCRRSFHHTIRGGAR